MNPPPRFRCAPFGAARLVFFFGVASAFAQPRVTLVTDAAPAAPVRYGLDRLAQALREKGAVPAEVVARDAAAGGDAVVAGLASGRGPAAALLKELNLAAPTAAESLLVQRVDWRGQKVWLVAGADDRGLMYALLDAADRVGWARDTQAPLGELREVREQPEVKDRAISIYTFQKTEFEKRLFDENYWARYFGVLAGSRFNNLTLIFGYENGGYFAPAYPWFFDTGGFDGVRVVGLPREQQEKNLRALNRLIAQAHAHGLDVTLGLWDHIYRGGVQANGVPGADASKPVSGLAWGVTTENLLAYSQAALVKFLRQVPGVDRLQFRMHDESGLKPGEETFTFWAKIFRVIHDTRPELPVELRAKGLPDAIIQLAADSGLHYRVETKYWMEQMGLPFHPTHVPAPDQGNRRAGYADLLHYPQTYAIYWRMFSGGTMRILLWGDPDFARRFVASTHLYGGDGFEVNEPLVTKMDGFAQDEPTFDLLNAPHRYYDYEFERYWHYFQVFGRLGYNPATPADVWEREFAQRFGAAGAPLEQALHRASWILPRIVAATFPYKFYPMTRGWPEKQRWDDLPVYATGEGSDTEQFQGFAEAARNQIDGTESARMHPAQTGEWFARTSREVLTLAADAERRAGANRSKEFESTVVDLKILAHLAEYHARRVRGGIAYALFKQAQDANLLDEAIADERSAVEAWAQIVAAAGDFYAADLKFGNPKAGLSGHWRDELVALQKGLEALEWQRKDFQPAAGIAHVPVRRLAPGEDLVVRATVGASSPLIHVQLALQGAQGAADVIELANIAPAIYRATVPAAKLGDGMSYTIETEAGGSRSSTSPVTVVISSDREPPAVEHMPVTSARVGEPVTITATVRDASGVKWVRLRHRAVDQYLDFQTLEMRPTGKPDEFSATVRAAEIPPRWDFMYFIEAMDTKGNGTIWPSFEREAPYVVVKLQR